MPGGTTVPSEKTKHNTFNAFCRKRFSGKYQIQRERRGSGGPTRGGLGLGQPSGRQLCFAGGGSHAGWSGQHRMQKSTNVHLYGKLLVPRQTLQRAVNVKIKKFKERSCLMDDVRHAFLRQSSWTGRVGRPQDGHRHTCTPGCPSSHGLPIFPSHNSHTFTVQRPAPRVPIGCRV